VVLESPPGTGKPIALTHREVGPPNVRRGRAHMARALIIGEANIPRVLTPKLTLSCQ